MRTQTSPPTAIVADDRLVARALTAALADLLDLVEPEAAAIQVIDRPAGAAPTAASVALVDAALDPWAMFDLGWAGVVDRTAPPERIAAAVHAVHAGLRVFEAPVATPAAGRALPPPDLTAREVEVLELLAQGLSNKEIGDALGISAHTAKFHVQGLLDKLDATTRTEAAVRAARLLLV